MKGLSLILVLAISLSGCATVKMHPEFDERHKEMRVINVLPPDIDVVEITFNAGNRPMPEVAAIMKQATVTQLNNLLSEKGYEYEVIELSDQLVRERPELREAYYDIQTLYKQALKDMKANKQKEFTYTVGSSPNVFADYKDSQAMLYIREVGIKKSKGQITAEVARAVGVAAGTLGLVVPTIHTKQMAIETAIIDSNLGDILWYNLKQTIDTHEPSNPRHVMNLVKDVFNAFPESVFKSAVLARKQSKTVVIQDGAAHVVSANSLEGAQAASKGALGRR